VTSSGFPAATAMAARTSMAIPRFRFSLCPILAGSFASKSWQGTPARFAIAGERMFRQSRPQMNKEFENWAARAAPSIFVVLWSTGFVATKYALYG
jgi:hypothetical protein